MNNEELELYKEFYKSRDDFLSAHEKLNKVLSNWNGSEKALVDDKHFGTAYVTLRQMLPRLEKLLILFELLPSIEED